uniref:Uncharacterized protein n=1 Tax=Anopheles farauti TaxID=69004 RepID=A0A182Q3E9_9DIPT
MRKGAGFYLPAHPIPLLAEHFRALARQLIRTFVAQNAAVSVDMVPLDHHTARVHLTLELDEIGLVFHGRTVGQRPVAALPSRQPFRDGVDHKLGVGVDNESPNALLPGEPDRERSRLYLPAVIFILQFIQFPHRVRFTTVRTKRRRTPSGTATRPTRSYPRPRRRRRSGHLLSLETLRNHAPLVVELWEQIFGIFQRLLGGVHLRLLYAVPVRARQTLAAEVHRHRVDARVRRSRALDHLVHRDVRFATVHRAQREAALLQLRLRIVPVLVHDEILQPREQTHVTEGLAVLEPLVHVERTEKRFQQIGPVLRFEVRLRVRVDGVLRHAEIVANDRLRAVVDERAAQQRQVALVVLREVPVQVLGADQLQHRVAQKLEPLVRAEREICEPDRAVRERARQQPDVVEPHPDRVLEAGERFQHLERLDVMPIAHRFLLLQRMRRIVHPDAPQRVILLEQGVRKDPIGHLDATVEQQRTHQRLETVGQCVPQLQLVAKVGPVRVQHELLQVQLLRQHGQMLVLHDRRPVRRQPALLQVREHVKQMDGGDELHHRIAEKLEPLVVRDVAVRLVLLAEPRHDADERVDAALARVHVVYLPVAVLRLPDATVREAVPRVVRIRAEVFLVRRVREGELERVAVRERVANVVLEHVQRSVEAQVARQHRDQHRMLHHVAHDAGPVERFRAHRDRNVPLHASLHAHLQQPVLLRLQLPLVLERRFRHVGDQMPELDVLPPRLLVLGITGVAELRRPDTEMHDHRMHQPVLIDRRRFWHIAHVPIELIHAHRARFHARIRHHHALHVVHVILPLVLAHVHHLLQHVGRHQWARIVEQIAQHLAHRQHLLPVVGQIAHEARQKVIAGAGAVLARPGRLHGEVDQLEQLAEEVPIEQVQLADGKVFRHLLLDVEDGVLDVEANYLARRQLTDRFVRQQRETLEQELVLIVLDDRGSFREEPSSPGYLPCRMPVRRERAEHRHSGPSFISPGSLYHRSTCNLNGCLIFAVSSSMLHSSSNSISSSDDSDEDEHLSCLWRHIFILRLRGGGLYGVCVARIRSARRINSSSNSVHSASRRGVDSTTFSETRL